MSATGKPLQLFNQPDRFVAGWYWVFASHELKPKQIKPVTLMGRDLAIYRLPDGTVVAIDAYCPHMGAHLAEGHIEADGIRCFFHNWKFNAEGDCVEVPALGTCLPVSLKSWPIEEQYGLIWVWTGATPQHPVPFVPELEHDTYESQLGSRFVKNCHPNVVMINAIDAHHFNTVHRLPLKIRFEKQELYSNAITFSNTTRGGENSWFIKLIRPFYKQAVTYSMCYWYGSTGTVTIGPDFFHFHIMFALRMAEGGTAEGQTVLITKRRFGLTGWVVNRVALWLTQRVGAYFAKGDTRIFQTIRFDLKTPICEDRSILQFIHNLEQQPAIAWESWETIAPLTQPEDVQLSSEFAL